MQSVSSSSSSVSSTSGGRKRKLSDDLSEVTQATDATCSSFLGTKKRRTNSDATVVSEDCKESTAIAVDSSFELCSDSEQFEASTEAKVDSADTAQSPARVSGKDTMEEAKSGDDAIQQIGIRSANDSRTRPSANSGHSAESSAHIHAGVAVNSTVIAEEMRIRAVAEVCDTRPDVVEFSDDILVAASDCESQDLDAGIRRELVAAANDVESERVLSMISAVEAVVSEHSHAADHSDKSKLATELRELRQLNSHLVAFRKQLATSTRNVGRIAVRGHDADWSTVARVPLPPASDCAKPVTDGSGDAQRWDHPKHVFSVFRTARVEELRARIISEARNRQNATAKGKRFHVEHKNGNFRQAIEAFLNVNGEDNLRADKVLLKVSAADLAPELLAKTQMAEARMAEDVSGDAKECAERSRRPADECPTTCWLPQVDAIKRYLIGAEEANELGIPQLKGGYGIRAKVSMPAYTCFVQYMGDIMFVSDESVVVCDSQNSPLAGGALMSPMSRMSLMSPTRAPAAGGSAIKQLPAEENEFRKVYRGSSTEALSNLYAFDLLTADHKIKFMLDVLPLKRRGAIVRRENEEAAACGKRPAFAPLSDFHLYTNDCRKNISLPKRSKPDRDRQNCDFVQCHINGFPAVFIVTTKHVAADSVFWTYYGEGYHTAFGQSQEYNQRTKTKRTMLSEKLGAAEDTAHFRDQLLPEAMLHS